MKWKSRFDRQFSVTKILHCLLGIACRQNEMRITALGRKGMPRAPGGIQRRKRGSQERLHEEPERAQDRLLVNCDKISFYEQQEQFTVRPELFRMAAQQLVRVNDIRGLCRFWPPVAARDGRRAKSTAVLVCFVSGVSAINGTEAYKTCSPFFVKQFLSSSKSSNRPSSSSSFWCSVFGPVSGQKRFAVRGNGG
jgi:hypothetical protein